MAVIGDLVTRLGVDGRRFQSGLDKARGDARSFASDITKIVSGIAIYDIGKSAVMGVFGLGKSTVELAATAETAAVQFKVLTGSADEAAEVMKRINKFAADTPFESMEITQAAKQLIAFGGSSKTVIGELQTLGDLSAGMGIPLTELAELYGKARIQGRLFMEDINQLQGRGINVTAQLAKEFGNVREAVEKGQVNFSHLEKALKAMTSEGGDFAGMMVDMSATFDGQLSTLVDNIKTIGRGIGEMILPRLKEVVSEANAMLGKFNEMPDRMKFIGEVIEASFDVAILTIRDKWDKMLQDMLKRGIQFGVDHTKNMLKVIELPVNVLSSPLETARAMADPVGTARDAMGMEQRQNQPNDLGAAMDRLAGLMGKLQGPPAAGNAAPANDPVAQAGAKFDAAIANSLETIAQSQALGAKVDEASAALKKAIGTPEVAGMTAKLKEAMAQHQTAFDAMEAASIARDAAEKEYYSTKASVAAAEEAAAREKTKQEGGRKLTEGVSSLWESLQSPIAEAQMAAQGIWDRTKIRAGAAMGTLSNIFSGKPTEKEQKVEPRLAGAMQAGSQEAYSTIVQAMIRQADPNVKATEKQTRELKKALKENRPQPVHLVAAFEM
jgi:hypothetical protein